MTGPVPLGVSVAGLIASIPGVRTFTVALPAGMELLTANQRPHWSARARAARELRRAAWACALAAKVPRLRRAVITVEYRPPDARRRDAGNLAPSGKAAIDGLVDAKVLPDDDKAHLLAEAYVIGEPCPLGRLVLHVTEVPG